MTARLLLIRHAERPPIPEGSFGNDLSLTEKGKQDCRRFAAQIDGPVHAIWTSPIRRCVQTAQLLAQTCNFNPDCIRAVTLLGDPGCFIHSPDIAGKLWQENTPARVKEILLSSRFLPDGFINPEEATTRLLNAMVSEMRKYNDGTILWITHDTILAPFASRVMSIPLNPEQWPDYLGYLEVVAPNSSSMSFHYSQYGQRKTNP